MKAQLNVELRNLEGARSAFAQGVKKCPNCVALWTQMSDFEIKQGNVTKARSVIEKARLRNPQNPELWLKAIRIENTHGKAKHFSVYV